MQAQHKESQGILSLVHTSLHTSLLQFKPHQSSSNGSDNKEGGFRSEFAKRHVLHDKSWFMLGLLLCLLVQQTVVYHTPGQLQLHR